ncbi:b(0,+)-type amino acid transporter 1-like [Asterias rubens]|uniref:b(0,+)-type amino acid transporter 1-like n=1 Tax=Asterias rubens TaxID=7604 RepID=UPI0014551BDF|nr:b(0,+)-type amino acid transporter 1-like [Asterias rubens]
MSEVRERDGSKKYSPSTNGGTGKKGLQDGDTDSQDGSKGLKLKRQVGLISGIAMIVGTMIGSGIFVSPKGVLRQTESVGMSLIVWMLCGVLSIIGALCYAELGTVIPKSGGEYAYLLDTLGPIPAFLFSWISTIVLKPSSVSAITLTFGAYASQALFNTDGGDCDPPTITPKLFAAVAIVLILFINCASVKWATSVQVVFTAAKLTALVIIIIVGVIKLFQGEVANLTPPESFATSSLQPFAYGVAFYQGLWAYDGWNQLNYMTEELVNPYRNLPLAIIIGIPLVTVLYLMVNISYFTVMTPAELLSSNAVAVTFASRTLGPMAWIIPFFVCCSTFGAANGSVFASGRLAFVTAREGHTVDVLSMVHVKRYTPVPALIFQAVIALIMIIPGDFDTLVNYFSFTAWLFYGATVGALLILRYKRPDVHRPIKVPIFIPIIVLIASVYLVIAPIIDEPALEYLFALLFILAGLVFYVPFVHYKLELPFMKHITVFFQLLLEVAPSSHDYKTEEIEAA